MRILSTLAALALAAVVPVAAAESTSAHEADHHNVATVLVTGDGSHVSLSRWHVDEGRVTFRESTSNAGPGGSQISLFRLLGKATIHKFKADLADEFSRDPAISAKGTRELNRDISASGLADIQKGNRASVQVDLRPGTYYLMDLGSFFGSNGPAVAPNPQLTKLVVRDDERDSSTREDTSGSGEESDGRHTPTIWLTSADRFVGPRQLPARGSVTFRNVGDSIHQAQLSPVKKGTTDKQIQAYFDSGVNTPPPFALDGPLVGLDILSAGNHATLTYNLPPGTYVLTCYVADDMTGMPHAFMGMHKVVILK